MSHKPGQKPPSLTLQFNTDIQRYVGINYGTVSSSVNECPSGAGRSAEVELRTPAPFSMEKAHGSGQPSQPLPPGPTQRRVSIQASTSGLPGGRGDALAVALETASVGRGKVLQRLPKKPQEEEPGRSVSSDWSTGHAPPCSSPQLPIGTRSVMHRRRVPTYRPSW